jgi:hypothetical protein
VKFTPKNIKKNIETLNVLFKFEPKNKENHKVIPHIIPKTAPKLKT